MFLTTKPWDRINEPWDRINGRHAKKKGYSVSTGRAHSSPRGRTMRFWFQPQIGYPTKQPPEMCPHRLKGKRWCTFKREPKQQIVSKRSLRSGLEPTTLTKSQPVQGRYGYPITFWVQMSPMPGPVLQTGIPLHGKRYRIWTQNKSLK